MSDRRIIHRVCPFCEATCGLAIEVEDNSIVTVRRVYPELGEGLVMAHTQTSETPSRQI